MLAIAFIYYLTGTLALLLAIPPGYASPIWPPAGVALSAVLLLGNRVWPGIFLGSFFINLWTTLDLFTALPIQESLALVSLIGLGATLQALIGASLIRRFVGFPTPLTKQRDVINFLVLGGPLSCAINPLVSVTSLWLAGIIGGEGYFFSWWTWWVGDTIGVIVLTPLVLVAMGEPRDVWRRRRIAAVSLAALFAMIAAYFLYARSWEETGMKHAFERQAEDLAEAMRVDVQAHLNALHSVEAFFVASDQISREDFRAFTQRLLMRYPAIQAVSWNPYVQDADRELFEKLAKTEGYSRFEITERDVDGNIVRAARRGDYVAVSYIEPYPGNEKALGFDVTSVPERREALERARDEGKPIATRWIQLVQETESQPGFLVFLPIYGRHGAIGSVEQRRRNVLGFIVGVFRVPDIVKASQSGLRREHIRLEFYDTTAPIREDMVYVDPKSKPELPAQGKASNLRFRRTIDMAGRTWVMHFSATPHYVASRQTWQSWGGLTIGLTLLALFGAYLLVMTGTAFETEKAANEFEQQSIELGKANNVKNEFLGVMSHELRTPLNVVMGYLGMVTDGLFGGVNQEQRQALETAMKQTREQLAMINSILQVTHFESGALTAERDVVSLRDLLKELEAAYGSRQDQSVILIWEVPTELPELETDATKLKQILQNLINNALKFSNQGSVKVSAAHDQATNSVTFRVEDTGIGIPPESLNKIFGKFYQVDSSHTRKYDGAGLGLYIVKQFSLLLGGKVEVQSELGRGSTFAVILPVGRVAGKKASTEAAA